MGGIAALITPPLAAHDCEIPAFAGMVYLGTGNCRRPADNCPPPPTIRRQRHTAAADKCQNPPTNPHSPTRPFLRRQESQVHGRQRRFSQAAATIGDNNTKIRPQTPVPPEDHSCVGRNLTVSYMHNTKIRRRFPFPHKTIPA